MGLCLVLGLAGCGGGQPPTVVSFGDSLSDVSTYGPAIPGGGRFTVNGPGPRVWVEFIAAELGQTLEPAQRGGVALSGPNRALAAPATRARAAQRGGVALSGPNPVNLPPRPTSGRAYAQGGARIEGPGITTIDGASLSAVPVAEQVARFEAAPVQGFALLLVNGGGNDLAFWGQRVLAGAASVGEARAGVEAAARRLVQLALALAAHGRVLVLNQADGALAPVAAEPAVAALYRDLTPRFNAALAAALDSGDVALFDQYALSRRMALDPATFGLRDTRNPACALTQLPLPSAALCTDQTLVAPDAAQTHQWAHRLHGTPAAHRALAQAVLAELRRRGWLS